jgi:hypothetical protein
MDFCSPETAVSKELLGSCPAYHMLVVPSGYRELEWLQCSQEGVQVS